MNVVAKKSQAGFTMVEICIVLLSVGLLIGGLFYGLNLINHSKILSTGARAETYRAALDEFTSKYAALPGDMANATARIAACTSGCGNPVAGPAAGNGVVGTSNLDVFGAAGTGGEDRENALFWYHLTAAGFINHIALTTNIGPGTTWGQSHPAAPAAGGYVIRSMSGINAAGAPILDAGGVPMTGIYLRWQGGSPYDAGNTTFIVSPRDARTIDVKFDDGNPLSGSVQARGTNAGFPNAADGCRLNISTYNEVSGTLACYMYFKIRDAAGL